MAILMRYDPNLRGDLAKLSDTELATRVDSTIKELDRTAPTFGLWMVFRGTRGPLRHPWFYKIRLLLAGIPWWDFADGGTGRRHLLECELQDLRDELQRRVQMRNTSRVSS